MKKRQARNEPSQLFKKVIYFIVSLFVIIVLMADYLYCISLGFFPEDWKKTIVTIERFDPKEKTYSVTGTGFFVIRSTGFEPVFLVTCAHVLESENTIYVGYNLKSGQRDRSKLKLINEDGTRIYKVHPDPSVDIAALRVEPSSNVDYKLIFYDKFCDITAFTDEVIDIRVLGFPLGIVGAEYVNPIVRSGIVSLPSVRDIGLKDESGVVTNPKAFLIDTFVFPGSSGSPIFYKRVTVEGNETKVSTGFAGIIKAYLPYREVAISAQTKRPRIVFEENSGLAVVFPPSLIKEVIDQFFEKQ